MLIIRVMAGTAFGNAMEFMVRLGVFETVLPFLLVFTLVFAFLEKTKIFGTEEYRSESDGKHYTITRKSLNSMIAFTIAFFVIASTQMVALINIVISRMVLVLILVFAFILTVGSMQKQTKEGFFLDGTWKIIFEVIAFIGIALIFLDALGWLDKFFSWIAGAWESEATAAVIMVIVLIAFIMYITWSKDPSGKSGGSKKKDDD